MPELYYKHAVYCNILNKSCHYALINRYIYPRMKHVYIEVTLLDLLIGSRRVQGVKCVGRQMYSKRSGKEINTRR
jgi:hypothetical protein